MSGPATDITIPTVNLKFTTVYVSAKRVPEYVHYIRGALQRGNDFVHLFAQGALWIAKAHRITDRLVADGFVNVFGCDVGQEPGDRNFPFIVITLVTSEKLLGTSKNIWDPSQLLIWEQKAQEYPAANHQRWNWV